MTTMATPTRDEIAEAAGQLALDDEPDNDEPDDLITQGVHPYAHITDIPLTGSYL